MKKICIFIFVLLCTNAYAQLLVNGKNVFFDAETRTLLATVPKNLFGHDAALPVEIMPGWQDVTIDSQQPVADTPFLFSQLSAERKWPVKATKADGSTLEATLQFTFLPIVQLLPSAAEGFSNVYQQAAFVYSQPESATTDTLTARIKWRGGTTNTPDKHKRNYKVNFDTDQRFFSLRNDDKWMLDAGQPDVFRLRNRIAMDLWNKMARKPYYADQEPKALNGVRGDVVELFLGDEWRGIYNLSEFIDRKQLKLKKIDSQTGEIRGCLYKGVSWNKVQMFDYFDSYDNTKDTFHGYEFKYPELGDDSDTVDWAPFVEVNNFVNKSTDKDFQEHIDEYVDMPVLTDYHIFFNVVNALDNAGKNMYWAVYDKTASRRITPAPWDLDATFGQRWGGKLVYEVVEGLTISPEFRMDFELLLTDRMFEHNFNDYLGQLNERYRQLRQPGQPLHTDSILALVEGYYTAVKNSGAASREEAKWSGDSDVWGDVIDFDKEYAYICDWICRRMEFIDQSGLPMFYTKSYFDELSVNLPSRDIGNDSEIYNLSGLRVKNTANLQPGIYIRNGKKVVIK